MRINTSSFKKRISNVNKFTLDTFLYTFGDLLNKGIIFLTIPIFSRMLNVEDYGILSLYQILYSILIVLITLNFPGAVSQRLFEKQENEEVFILVNFKFIVVFSLIFLLTFGLGELLFDFSNLIGLPSEYYFICLTDVFLVGFLSFYQATLLGRRNSKLYVINSIASSGGGVIISIVFMLTIFKYDELLGQFIGKLLVPLIFCIIILNKYRSAIGVPFKINKKLIIYSISFGVPLIPHLVSNLVLRQFDRIIINKYMGLTSTGIYSLASNLSFILPVLIGAINKSWVPVFQDLLRDKNYENISKKVKSISLIFLMICVLLILQADIIFKIVAPPEYYDGYKIFQLLVFGSYFLFAYNSFVNYAYFTRKTYSIALITVIIGVLSLSLNFILIPKYFMFGAAFSFIGGAIFLFLIHFLNVKYFLKIECVSPMIFIKHSIILSTVLISSFLFSGFLFNNFYGLLIRSLISFFVLIVVFIKRDYFLQTKKK